MTDSHHEPIKPHSTIQRKYKAKEHITPTDTDTCKERDTFRVHALREQLGWGCGSKK